MNFQRFTLALAAAAAATVTAVHAQQSVVAIHDDDITIRGCIRRVDFNTAAPATIVWSRSDIMLGAVATLGTGVPGAIGTSGMAGRVFYWLDDDDDLSQHIGQLIEVRGELKDFETGQVKIDREDSFTEIEVDLDGRKEKARMPTAWLHEAGSDRDREFDIVTRRVDVDEVRVLGACNVP